MTGAARSVSNPLDNLSAAALAQPSDFLDQIDLLDIVDHGPAMPALEVLDCLVLGPEIGIALIHFVRIARHGSIISPRPGHIKINSKIFLCRVGSRGARR